MYETSQPPGPKLVLVHYCGHTGSHQHMPQRLDFLKDWCISQTGTRTAAPKSIQSSQKFVFSWKTDAYHHGQDHGSAPAHKPKNVWFVSHFACSVQAFPYFRWFILIEGKYKYSFQVLSTLQNVRFRYLATHSSLFGKGVIIKTPGVRHSAGHSEFPDPRCPQASCNKLGLQYSLEVSRRHF